MLLFFISPKQSYAFSQLLESHAVDTYSEFVHANAEVLKSLPVPAVAHVYFNEFLFYYYEFQTSEEGDSGNRESRVRPQLSSLFDVFQNILADEVLLRQNPVVCKIDFAQHVTNTYVPCCLSYYRKSIPQQWRHVRPM